MKLIKEENIINLTDEFVIEIFKENGWEELKEELKKEQEEQVQEIQEVPKTVSKSKKSKK